MNVSFSPCWHSWQSSSDGLLFYLFSTLTLDPFLRPCPNTGICQTWDWGIIEQTTGNLESRPRTLDSSYFKYSANFSKYVKYVTSVACIYLHASNFFILCSSLWYGDVNKIMQSLASWQEEWMQYAGCPKLLLSLNWVVFFLPDFIDLESLYRYDVTLLHRAIWTTLLTVEI